MRKITLLSLILLFNRGVSAAPELWYKSFRAYPGAHRLCEQDLVASVGSVSWMAYTSTDAPDKIKAFYRAQYPKQAKTVGKNFAVKFSDDKKLRVFAKGAAGCPILHPAPGPEAQSVIVVDAFIPFDKH